MQPPERESCAARRSWRLAVAELATVSDAHVSKHGLLSVSPGAVPFCRQVLVIAAQAIAELPSNDASAQPRAKLLLQHLDKWAQQHPQPSPQEADLWKRLQTLPWCPVLDSPPEPGLPWPHTPPQQHQQQQQQGHQALPEQQQQLGDIAGVDQPPPQPPPQQVWRAAPKMVAPAELAWLVSGPLRLLALSSPSRQLQELLGWTQEQVLRPFTASMQLVQLGDKYPAGTVSFSVQEREWGSWCTAGWLLRGSMLSAEWPPCQSSSSLERDLTLLWL